MVFLFGKGLVLKKYIKKRLIDLIPILIGISFLSFLLMYLSPNDPAQLMLSANGQAYTKEQLNIVRENLGLNEPFLKQYFSWALGCLHGDFGTSYITGKPVSETLLNALWPTIQLSITSLIFTLVISIPLGILSAVKKNKVADYIIRIFSFIGSAVPGFLLALILIYVFSIKLGVLPAYGNNKQYSIVMPTITLGLGMTCKYIRQVRASILEELNKPYVLGARSRGVKESTVIYLNVLKNSMLTISTLINNGLVSKGRLFCFSIELKNVPGELLKISEILAKENANVVKLEHNQFKAINRIHNVLLEVTVETNGHEHIEKVINSFEREKYCCCLAFICSS